MGQFKRAVTIRCPVDKAFDYVTDWQNLKSFLSIIIEISPISFVQSGPGAAFDTVFKLGGANIPTTLEVLEFVRDKKMILKSRQGLKMEGGWEFRTAPEGTIISFSIQYELPPGLARTDRDRQLVEKDFDDSAMQSLQLVRWILESRTLRGQDGKQ